MSEQASSASWLGGLRPTSQWGLLVALSVGFAAVLIWAGVPAAVLLGPMLAGIIVTSSGGRLNVPGPAFALAQGVLGCMIARILPMSISADVVGRWPLLVAGALAVIVASGLLGWLMTRTKILPGTTVLWGLSPGAATAMILMAADYGADAQLVAFMQYLRVVVVAAIASGIARFYGVSGALNTAHGAAWFSVVDWRSLAETLALAALGPIVGRWLRFPAAGLLFPLFAGVILVAGGWMTIELPRPVLTIAYALIGWRIGLRFTRELLVYAWKALPRIALCTLALIAICGGLGGLLVVIAGIDPLTAYLATSPGGADSAAIIAASTNVDASFVMAMQTIRFVGVLIIGPAIARFVAGRVAATDPVLDQ